MSIPTQFQFLFFQFQFLVQFLELSQELTPTLVDGCIGLTENPPELNRWMKSGSEIARLVSEFECNFQGPRREKTYHHEQTTAIQSEFFRDVNSLLHVIKQLGDTFSDDSGTLSTINTEIQSKNVMMLTTYL